MASTTSTFRIFSILRMLLASAALLFASFSYAQEGAPTEAVKSTVNSILEILRKPNFSFSADRPAIRVEIQKAFDDVAMAQSVLSTNWKDASQDEQNEFKSLLMQTIESTYIGRIKAYTDETVAFRDERINRNRAEVNTAVLAASGEIPIVYKLRERSDGWFVYDVEIENVSMVSTYRETYRSVVRRSGMNGLLQQMREKIAELEAKENG